MFGGALTRTCVVCNLAIAIESESLQASIFGPMLAKPRADGALYGVEIATAHMRCVPPAVATWLREHACDDREREGPLVVAPSGFGASSFQSVATLRGRDPDDDDNDR